MKKLINDHRHCVSEAIDGLILSNSNLKRVPGINAVIRSDVESSKDSFVSLISGGGSGHEPAHAGFIGYGMLTGAVLGNVFASPAVTSILATIRACAGKAGVLLIVKNYTGDRLNFGIALEKARLEGISIKMVIVDDDCALSKEKGITGGRGIAGTILVHKIAGAAAAAGRSLNQVHLEAMTAISRINTLGIAFSMCTIPGNQPSSRLNDNVFEVGMGIHGEPGKELKEIPPNCNNLGDTIANILVDTILDGGAVNKDNKIISKSDDVAILINNLGTTPILEMLIVTRRILLNLLQRGKSVTRVYMGSYMTSLEMKGISLSIMNVTDTTLALLDAGTNAPAWIACPPLHLDTLLNNNNNIITTETDHPNNKQVTVNLPHGGFICPYAIRVVNAIARQLIKLEPQLTEYDSICGDGDCGLTMRNGAERVLTDLERLRTSQPIDEGDGEGERHEVDSVTLCCSLADSVSASMGGTSGALLELMLRSMASHMQENDAKNDNKSNSQRWIGALSVGVSAIKSYGGAEVGMRTMLDALVPASQSLLLNGNLELACQAAESGSESTKAMSGCAGRSNYIESSKMSGTPDPGAAAVASAFRAAFDVLT